MHKSIELMVGEIGEWLGAGSLNFFGKPFAGKDEQSVRFGKQLDAPVLSGGNILRNSVIPPDIQASMERGELISSESYKAIVLPFLSQTAFRGKPLMLSSVGRVAGEEVGVLEATRAAGHPIMAVPYLAITDEEAFRRLRATPDRGRKDDTPASLRIRLEEFNAKTTPVLEGYETMDLLVPVSAMEPKDIVFDILVHALHQRASSS